MLRHAKWPGSEPLMDYRINELPQEIQDWYELDHQMIAAKLMEKDRIVIWFQWEHMGEYCEVWFKTDKWIHFGPRKRK